MRKGKGGGGEGEFFYLGQVVRGEVVGFGCTLLLHNVLLHGEDLYDALKVTKG
jgi:hypothetical protein